MFAINAIDGTVINMEMDIKSFIESTKKVPNGAFIKRVMR